ncbi:class I adenylate-forming enzyme family protein [Nocardia sp. CC213A]|nr:class I adenylate-forming enzyme family protein [Nocardia sp. CC213A]
MSSTERVRVVSVAVDHFVWHRAEFGPGAPSLEDHRLRWGYREFAERVDSAAAQLAVTGVRRGATVAIVLPNRLELLVALMAVWRLGAIAAPLDPDGDEPLIEEQIVAADAVVVLDDRPVPGPSHRIAGVPRLAIEVLARPVPVGWVAPPDPKSEDSALVCFGSGAGPDCGVFSHGWLREVAADTIRCLGLTGSDHCRISLPLARADVIGMNFVAAMVLGSRLSLVSARTSPNWAPPTGVSVCSGFATFGARVP